MDAVKYWCEQGAMLGDVLVGWLTHWIVARQHPNYTDEKYAQALQLAEYARQSGGHLLTFV